MTRRRRRKISLEMLGVIRELEARGMSSRDIHNKIVKRFESPPSDRAIRDVMTPRDETDPPWALGIEPETETADVALVAGEVLRRSGGRRRLSWSEARWVTRVYAVASEIPPWIAYLTAREYVLRRHGDEDTADLDAYLALRGWEPGAGTGLSVPLPSIGMGEDPISERRPEVAPEVKRK